MSLFQRDDGSPTGFFWAIAFTVTLVNGLAILNWCDVLTPREGVTKELLVAMTGSLNMVFLSLYLDSKVGGILSEMCEDRKLSTLSYTVIRTIMMVYLLAMILFVYDVVLATRGKSVFTWENLAILVGGFALIVVYTIVLYKTDKGRAYLEKEERRTKERIARMKEREAEIENNPEDYPGLVVNVSSMRLGGAYVSPKSFIARSAMLFLGLVGLVFGYGMYSAGWLSADEVIAIVGFGILAIMFSFHSDYVTWLDCRIRAGRLDWKGARTRVLASYALCGISATVATYPVLIWEGRFTENFWVSLIMMAVMAVLVAVVCLKADRRLWDGSLQGCKKVR